jgi:hypothetical protein
LLTKSKNGDQHKSYQENRFFHKFLILRMVESALNKCFGTFLFTKIH